MGWTVTEQFLGAYSVFKVGVDMRDNSDVEVGVADGAPHSVGVPHGVAALQHGFDALAKHGWQT